MLATGRLRVDLRGGVTRAGDVEVGQGQCAGHRRRRRPTRCRASHRPQAHVAPGHRRRHACHTDQHDQPPHPGRHRLDGRPRRPRRTRPRRARCAAAAARPVARPGAAAARRGRGAGGLRRPGSDAACPARRAHPPHGLRVGGGRPSRAAPHLRRRRGGCRGAADRLHLLLRRVARLHLHPRSGPLGDRGAHPFSGNGIHVPAGQLLPRLPAAHGRRGRRHPRPGR